MYYKRILAFKTFSNVSYPKLEKRRTLFSSFSDTNIVFKSVFSYLPITYYEYNFQIIIAGISNVLNSYYYLYKEYKKKYFYTVF